MGQANASETERRNRKVGIVFACMAAGMLGMAYAAVPLYRIFCQATGYDGTPRRASVAPADVLERTVTVRFDANSVDLPWTFEPVQRQMVVKIGENALAFYRAHNNSDQPITGSATFNVSPEITASYFNKLACFCFTEQTLKPGESVDMGVSFFVDPAIVKDMDARKVGDITLSYTFYPVAKPRAQAKVQGGVDAGLNSGGAPRGKGG